MPVQFAVLASGSRGNSTLVRGRGAGLLIDVGIGPRALGQRLESVGASWSHVAAVALTHTHGDHIDSGTFAELSRRQVAVHCHDGHRAALAGDPGFQRQPFQRERPPEAQLRRFMGTRSGRKAKYAQALVGALDLARIPRPLELLLARI